MFEKLIQNLDNASIQLKNLKKDIEHSKNPLESKLQQLTRLRANIEEVKQAQENPELQKAKDRLSDILKSI
jgi:hypothetical protein